MAEQEQNRSEPATPFKLAEAKKNGQVAKSLDFNSFVVVGAALMVLLTSGEELAARVCRLCAQLFQSAGRVRMESVADAAWLGDLIAAGLTIIAPFAVAGAVCAILGNLLQTGPVFSLVPLQPKFERLNPVTGLKRVFTRKLLFEAVKTVLKLGLFAWILYIFGKGLLPALPAVAVEDPRTQAAWLAACVGALVFRLGLALLVAGLVDLAFVRWQFGKQMMMSRRELKEEMKRREGDPQIRAKIRELQRENLKQARSLGRVPEADVLITNPDHFAVALRYVRGEMSAPCVIAKGTDAWAVDMKAVARRHGIPVFERRSLARLLFRRVQIDHAIPSEAYVEIARIYADVEADKRRAMRYEVA